MPLRLQSLQVAGLDATSSCTPIEDAATPPFRPFGADPQHRQRPVPRVRPRGRAGDLPAADHLPGRSRRRGSSPTPPTPGCSGSTGRAPRRTAGARWTPTTTGRGRSPAAATSRSPDRATACRWPRWARRSAPLHWLRCRLAAGRYAAGQAPDDRAAPLQHRAGGQPVERDRRAGRAERRPHATRSSGSATGRCCPSTCQVVRTVPPAGRRPPCTRRRGRSSATSSSPGRTTATSPSTRVDGELRFGDGQHGQVPLAGFDIVVSLPARRHQPGQRPAGLDHRAADAPPRASSRSPTSARPSGGRTRRRARACAAAPRRGCAATSAPSRPRTTASSPGGSAASPTPPRSSGGTPTTPASTSPVASPSPSSPTPTEQGLRQPASCSTQWRPALAPARTIGTELFVRSARFVRGDRQGRRRGRPLRIVRRDQRGRGTSAGQGPGPRAGDDSASAATRFGQDFFPTDALRRRAGRAGRRRRPAARGHRRRPAPPGHLPARGSTPTRSPSSTDARGRGASRGGTCDARARRSCPAPGAWAAAGSRWPTSSATGLAVADAPDAGPEPGRPSVAAVGRWHPGRAGPPPDARVRRAAWSGCSTGRPGALRRFDPVTGRFVTRGRLGRAVQRRPVVRRRARASPPPCGHLAIADPDREDLVVVATGHGGPGRARPRRPPARRGRRRTRGRFHVLDDRGDCG